MASLRDLGLSEYESRAYRALLETGPTTAKELSRVSDVPMGRIYDVLNAIEGYELVRSQSASRPKEYVAVEPSTALERLLDDKKRDLEAAARQYEEVVDELRGELATAGPVEETFWTAAVGPDDTVDLLVERLSTAESRIEMVLSTYSPQSFDQGGATVVDELAAALDRGISVRLLMRPDLVPVVPEQIGERHPVSLSSHEAFAARTSDDVSGTFTLIDRTETVVEVPRPLRSREAFAMIDFKDPGFADSVREAFEPRWEDARDVSL